MDEFSKKISQLMFGGDYDVCIDLINQRLKETPGDPALLVKLGYCHDQAAHVGGAEGQARERHFDEAARIFGSLAAMGSGEFSGLKGLSTVALHRGDFVSAKSYAEKAMRLGDGDHVAPVAVTLGNAERALGNHERAVEMYRKAMEAMGENWSLWSNIALAASEGGMADTAVEAARKALVGMPEGEHPALKNQRSMPEKIIDDTDGIDGTSGN